MKGPAPSGYLHSGFCEVDSAGKVLAHESVRVVCPLEDPLQCLQLTAVERGPVPPLLPLLLILRVELVIWKGNSHDQETWV